MPPRTIDNLGLDASARYAADQQELEIQILKESKIVPKQAEVDVSQPSFTSEFDLLFDTPKKNTPWAKFSPPENYYEQRKRLFTYQIIPSLGPQDKTESQEKKLLAQLKEKVEAPVFDSHQKGLEALASSWEEEREKEQQIKEQQVLVQLLKNLTVLDKCMSDISARRMQYQKG